MVVLPGCMSTQAQFQKPLTCLALQTRHWVWVPQPVFRSPLAVVGQGHCLEHLLTHLMHAWKRLAQVQLTQSDSQLLWWEPELFDWCLALTQLMASWAELQVLVLPCLAAHPMVPYSSSVVLLLVMARVPAVSDPAHSDQLA